MSDPRKTAAPQITTYPTTVEFGRLPSGPGFPLQAEPSASIPGADGVWGTRDDPLYDEACEVVRTQKRAAISTVQRYLRIGYNRAAGLLEAMVGDVIAEMPPTTKLLPARGIVTRQGEDAPAASVPQGLEPGR